MNIVIDKGVPLPGRRIPTTKRLPTTRFPFREMKVGDSFLVPKDVTYESLKVSAYQFGVRNPGYKFSVRRTADGMRCWRVRRKREEKTNGQHQP